MDLKIKDVAELLNVSETTIRRWLQDEKIPAYKIHGQYRFSRIEIESWVLRHKLGHADGTSPFSIPLEIKSHPSKGSSKEQEKATGGSQKFSLYRALHKGQVILKVPGSTKEEVIRNCTRELSSTLKLDGEVLSELLIDREKLQSTALNNGIAVPHTRDFVLSAMHDVVAVAYPEKPIPYGALDGKPIHTLIFLFACHDKRHLHLLAKIAHLSSQSRALNLLLKRPPKEKLLAFVQTWEGRIATPQED